MMLSDFAGLMNTGRHRVDDA